MQQFAIIPTSGRLREPPVGVIRAQAERGFVSRRSLASALLRSLFPCRSYVALCWVHVHVFLEEVKVDVALLCQFLAVFGFRLDMVRKQG